METIQSKFQRFLETLRAYSADEEPRLSERTEPIRKEPDTTTTSVVTPQGYIDAGEKLMKEKASK